MTAGAATRTSILHVDDDRDLAELTATYLTREAEEFTVETATSADEGLERLTDTDIDCIVSDYDMPGRNGIEFLSAVRERNADIPFILFTGKGSEEIASKAVSAGVTDYLQKSTGQSQYVILTNRIRNAVEQYRSRRAATRKRERLERQREAVLSLTTDDAVTAGQFETAAERITETAAAVLDVGAVNVWLFDDDRQLTCVDNYDAADDRHTQGTTLDAEQYPDYFSALQEHVTIAADDAVDDDRTSGLTDDYLTPLDIGAVIDATLRLEGEVIGVVGHEHVGGPRSWTDDEIQFAGHVAGIVLRAHRNRQHRRQQRRLEAVFDDPHILAGRLDTDGTLLEANQTALEYVSASQEAVTGKPFWETPWCRAEDASLIRRDVRRAAEGQYVEFEAEIPGPQRSVPVLGVLRPVYDESGDVTSLIVSARDVAYSADHRNN